MKKIKKFIDFEIVTILTILILISPFYFMLKYMVIENSNVEAGVETGVFEILDYQVQIDFTTKLDKHQLTEDMFKVQVKDLENNLFYISNSDFELISIITITVTIIFNIFVSIIMILVYMIKSMIINKNKRILSNEISIEEIEVPNYNIAIANTLYTGRIEFLKIFGFLKKYFEEKNIIDENGKVLQNVDINKFDNLEKEILLLCEKEHTYEVVKEFKFKVKDELEKKRFLKTTKLREKIDYIGSKVESAGLWVLSKDKSDTTRIFIETLLPIAILLFIACFKWLSAILIIAITYIQLKYYNIFLTKEGKIEKAKIALFIESIKNKKEVSKKEKFFYDALKFINL